MRRRSNKKKINKKKLLLNNNFYKSNIKKQEEVLIIAGNYKKKQATVAEVNRRKQNGPFLTLKYIRLLKEEINVKDNKKIHIHVSNVKKLNNNINQESSIKDNKFINKGDN